MNYPFLNKYMTPYINFVDNQNMIYVFFMIFYKVFYTILYKDFFYDIRINQFFVPKYGFPKLLIGKAIIYPTPTTYCTDYNFMMELS